MSELFNYNYFDSRCSQNNVNYMHTARSPTLLCNNKTLKIEVRATPNSHALAKLCNSVSSTKGLELYGFIRAC